MTKNKKNRHHLLPRSRGGNNHPKNILPWRMVKHDSFHHLNGNNIITERIWEDIQKDWHVLTDDFKKLVWGIVNIPPQKIYKKEVFKKSQNFDNLKSNFKEVEPIHSKYIDNYKYQEDLIKIIGKICNVGNLTKLNGNDLTSFSKLTEISNLSIKIIEQSNLEKDDLFGKIIEIRNEKTKKKKRLVRLEIIEENLKKLLKDKKNNY